MLKISECYSSIGLSEDLKLLASTRVCFVVAEPQPKLSIYTPCILSLHVKNLVTDRKRPLSNVLVEALATS